MMLSDAAQVIKINTNIFSDAAQVIKINTNI
jgi:hypothetical protein